MRRVSEVHDLRHITRGAWHESDLLFLRPRRFGKSLWLSVLANYYDLRTAGKHEILFGDLAVDRSGGPTPLAHRWPSGHLGRP